MCVFGPGVCSHAYLLFMLIAMSHQIRPLCGGKRIVPVPVQHSLNHSKGHRGRRLGLDAASSGIKAREQQRRVSESTGGDEVKVIQAHTLMLSLQSHTFQKLLEKRNESTLVLMESPECINVFEKFIRYLYCGELHLRLDETTALHELATKYGVSVLQHGLTEYMIQNLAGASLSGHVVHWYEYAIAEGNANLRVSCLQFLLRNTTSVLQSAQWPSIGSQLLMALLQPSDLVLHSELELFRALETWLMHNEPDNLTVENILRAVRYPMIPPRELFRLQRESQVLLRYYESVRDLLYKAYQFHAAPPPLLANALFSPRGARPDIAGVVFQKTVTVCARQQGLLVVRHVYNFHQSTEENGDFLTDSGLHESTSEYLVDGWLHLHVIIKPVYQTLIS
ncbi:BTB/POZ domain-containing protein 17 isoform X1 [Tachysurus ichikawai]